MKFLFRKNRKTLFLAKIAGHLATQGHMIFWLVQNHAFRPHQSLSVNVIVMSYPNMHEKVVVDKETGIQAGCPTVIKDRGRTHFQAASTTTTTTRPKLTKHWPPIDLKWRKLEAV